MKKNVNSNKKSQFWWMPGLQMFTKLSVWIVIPIISALFVGNFLDEVFNTEPWFSIFLVTIAFFFSIGIIVYFGKKELTFMARKDINRK